MRNAEWQLASVAVPGGRGRHSENGGEGGIRTLGSLSTTRDFQSRTFDHSATSPVFGRPPLRAAGRWTKGHEMAKHPARSTENPALALHVLSRPETFSKSDLRGPDPLSTLR